MLLSKVHWARWLLQDDMLVHYNLITESIKVLELVSCLVDLTLARKNNVHLIQ